MRVHHGVAQLVQQQPRAFVAAEPELGLKLQGRDAIRVAAEKMDRREPDGQRQLAAMHHGAGRHRSVPAATCALPGEPFPRQFPALDTAATRAHEPVWPTRLKEMPRTSRLVGKALRELGSRHRTIILPPARHENIIGT